MKAESLDNILERAFWRFDALHKAHYRDADRNLPGPMAEREAFKCVVRDVVLDALGVKYARWVEERQTSSASGEEPK